MSQLKAIKVKLYPTAEQSVNIAQLVGCYRKAYNLCLDHAQNYYDINEKYCGMSELSHYFHNDIRNDVDLSYMNIHNTKIIKQSLRNLNTAYIRFFKSIKGDIKGIKVGLPKHKKKCNYEKACFPLETIPERFLSGINNSRLNLSKGYKDIPYRCSNEFKQYLIENQNDVRSITIERCKDGTFFASILIKNDVPLPKKNPIKTVETVNNKFTGIDFGIKTLMVVNFGGVRKKYESRKPSKTIEKQIKRLQRKIARNDIFNTKKYKKVEDKYTVNRAKKLRKIAKLNKKITNQQKDYLHCISKDIVNNSQVIIIEDLNISNMKRNKKLSKAFQDTNIGELRDLIVKKGERNNRLIIKVGRYYPSSKLCSVCKYKKYDLKLSDREWICPQCGQIHDRDENASDNILGEGIRLFNKNIGLREPELKPVEQSMMDDKEVISPKKLCCKESGNEDCISFYTS